MSARKNIVILGGSYGGLAAAHCVLKHTYPELPDKETYQVVLVSIAAQVTSRPAAVRDIVSEDLLDQKKLWVDIPPLFDQYPQGSFRFIKGAATSVDHTNRKVTIRNSGDDKTEDLDFYALVVATGCSTASPLMGFNHEDETYVKARRAEFRNALSSAKSVVICGGGPTGVETAGELGEHFNGRPSWWPCWRQPAKLEITVVTSAEQILPLLPAKIANNAENLLSKVGVSVIKKTKVVSVTPEDGGVGVASPTHVVLSDGREINADIYIPAVGFNANTRFINEASLLAADGRIKVDNTLRVHGAGPRIYAIGDCCTFARQAIHNIQSAVPVLATNMKRDLLADAGKTQPGADREFKEETRVTQMVPIGRSKGVGAFNGTSVPSLLVWALKGRDYWLWTTPNQWSGKQWNKI